MIWMGQNDSIISVCVFFYQLVSWQGRKVKHVLDVFVESANIKVVNQIIFKNYDL